MRTRRRRALDNSTGQIVLLLVGWPLVLWAALGTEYTRHAVHANRTQKTAVDHANTTDSRLVAAVVVRLWPLDAFGMTASHLRDWIAYLAFAGVSELRVYDHGLPDTNTNNGSLFGQPEGLTLRRIPWRDAPYAEAQRLAYADAIHAAQRRPDAERLWLMTLDVDEYPFSPVDTRRGFLLRHLAGLTPEVAQVLMRSLFFGGPSDLATQPDVPLPAQFVHRQPEAEAPSQRTKYMARVARIAPEQQQPNIVHWLHTTTGSDRVSEPEVLRVNHYWGYRLGKPLSALVKDTQLSLSHYKS